MNRATDAIQGSNHTSSVIEEVNSRISYLEQPGGQHQYHGSIHKDGFECGPCGELWALMLVRRALQSPEYCGDCDGVGWVEGGTAIQTTCTHCEGSGWEPIRWTEY